VLDQHIVRRVVEALVTVSAMIVVTQQCRKPAGLPGRLFVWIMNRSHSDVTRWGLGHVAIEQGFTILDVGCGGGKTVQTLAGITTDGMVYGADYSAASVAAARRLNARLIEAGKVDIRQGTVSRLPYGDGIFDLVSAIETHYYWPDPAADMREILRVLKPGGRFVVIGETYKGRRFDALYAPVMKLLRATYLTVGEHRDLLAAAGYADVEVFEERNKGWVCAVGRRPVSLS
jgi:SAM-dependent methyltransferase